MKKIIKKFAALIVSVMLITALLPTSAFAENWNPDDTITINVRVYDASTGNVYNVGTDSVTKGDQYIQSDLYRIPELSRFTSYNYGRVTKVVGNWYFPSGNSSVGVGVYWSCNSNTATMTYWVTQWSAPSSSGSGSSSSANESQGGGTKTTWTQTIVYHSNYPNGADNTLSVTYSCGSFTSAASVTGSLKAYKACGFVVPEGYSLADRYWNTKADGTGTSYGTGIYTYKKSDGTVHLYAQYVPDIPSSSVTAVNVTYINDGDTYAAMSALAGDTMTVIDCTDTKEGNIFKGWDTSPAAKTVVYEPGDTFVINTDTTLYAVWEQMISFRGAAIRVPETYYYPAGEHDNTVALNKTNLRFGYVITLPDGVKMDDIAWSWNWGTDEENLNYTVSGSEYIDLGNNTYRTNLVITNIPIDSDYGTPIHSQLTLTYTNGAGEEITIVDPVQTRSVQFVAEAIKNSIDRGACSETDKVQSYVTDLVNKVNENKGGN